MAVTVLRVSVGGSIVPASEHRPTRAEIDLDAIRQNVAHIKALLAAGTEVMAVVKANGYGHGALPVARAALQAGATQLGVATVDEAAELRQGGITAPVLVLGPTTPAAMRLARDLGVTVTVHSLETARAAREIEGLRVHLKVDTGMGRLGFPATDEGVRAVAEAKKLLSDRAEGIFTHLSDADNEDQGYTLAQLDRFEAVLKELAGRGFEFRFVHAANSAATLALKRAHYNLVRPGLAVYGLYPAPWQKNLCELRPALSLKTAIDSIKELPAGWGISYGHTVMLDKPRRVGVLPAGYADGVRRGLSGRLWVLVGGRRVKTLGRVCMDQIVVDLQDVGDPRPGDEAVLLGCQGNECITADEWAEITGTINYEIVTGVSARVPRVYLHP